MRQARTNPFLSPFYWGTLAAFMVGLLLMVATAVSIGPSPTIFRFELAPEHQDVVFSFTVAIVALFLVRYYLAIATQMHIGFTAPIQKIPAGVARLLYFGLLALLTFLCSVNTFVLTTLGVQVALFVCLALSIVSLLMLGLV